MPPHTYLCHAPMLLCHNMTNPTLPSLSDVIYDIPQGYIKAEIEQYVTTLQMYQMTDQNKFFITPNVLP